MSDIGPVVPPPPVAATAPATPPASTPAPAPAVPQQPAGQGGQPLPQPQQQTPAPPAAGGDPAAQISAALRELAQGGQISAQVVARDNAALLVRTAAGATLALNNLAAALEQANVAVLNAALKLQLNPANPSQATVTQANNAVLQPPLTALAQPPTAAQLAIALAPPQQAAATPAAPAALPQPGQSLAAVVVSSPPAAAPPGGAPLPAAAALPPGSQLQVVVKSVALPVTTPTPPSAAAPPSGAAQIVAAVPSGPAPGAPATPAPALPSAPVITPAATAPPAQAVPAGEARSLANPQPATRVALPPAPVPASPPPMGGQAAALPLPGSAPPTLISGIVSGPGQAGQVLVSTPQGTLSLSLPQPLPPGTQISFELSALVRPPAPAVTSHGPAPLAGILTRLQGEWPVLQQTLDAVRAADPALAQRLQADLLPQPNGRLASTALQFMAAAAIGSAQAWLGSEAVRRLEQSGKTDLLRKLDDDFRELGKLNQRQGDNNWQALVMPMLIGGRIEPIQIFMRRRRDPKRKLQQTRFIIDFDLESTGPIQFDGFVTPQQLDLILRSESEFGPAFRVDVTQIFTTALEITGMTGSIRFHDGEAPLAWPSPELEAAGPSTEVKA